MIGPQGGSGPGWYYKGKHYDSPQLLHEEMNADLDALRAEVEKWKRSSEAMLSERNKVEQTLQGALLESTTIAKDALLQVRELCQELRYQREIWGLVLPELPSTLIVSFVDVHKPITKINAALDRVTEKPKQDTGEPCPCCIYMMATGGPCTKCGYVVSSYVVKRVGQPQILDAAERCRSEEGNDQCAKPHGHSGRHAFGINEWN